ncbi:hypothetical protein CCACVL1_22502, partial [Corchorus capsularis]
MYTGVPSVRTSCSIGPYTLSESNCALGRTYFEVHLHAPPLLAWPWRHSSKLGRRTLFNFQGATLHQALGHRGFVLGLVGYLRGIVSMDPHKVEHFATLMMNLD